MSVWDLLSSTKDALKRKTPDITPVTETCWKGYDVTRTATVHVSRTVVTKARDLHACMSDDQVRGDLTRVVKNLSVHGGLYIVRSYGGGPIIDVLSRSLHDGKADSQKERLKDLEAKVAKLEKELSSRKVSEHSEISTKTMASKLQDDPDRSSASLDQRLEGVLQNFIMQNFVGTKLFDNMLVPGTAQSKKENLGPRTDGKSE